MAPSASVFCTKKIQEIGAKIGRFVPFPQFRVYPEIRVEKYKFSAFSIVTEKAN